MLYYTVVILLPYYTILYDTIQYCPMLTELYYTILPVYNDIRLYYVMLCYAMVCSIDDKC